MVVYELRPYQLDAVDRFKDSDVICLGLEMGLGKTAIALRIAAHKFRKQKINALLVIAPNDVHKQWATEQIPAWWPTDLPRQVQCFGGRGGTKKPYPFKADNSIQILCVNIDTFSTPAKWEPIVQWANTMRTMIVLDEATVIKNPKALRTERLLYDFNDIVRSGRRIVASVPYSVARCVLTGTPVTNGSADIWSIMEFVKPNFFNRNYYSFKDRYSMYATLKDADDRMYPVLLSKELWGKIKKITDYNEARDVFQITADTFEWVHSQDEYGGPYKHSAELKELLDSVWFYKHWTDPDMAGSIPEPVHIQRKITMSDEQKKIYERMRKEYIAEYDGKIMTAANKMTVMLRLQQISSGFIYEKPLENEDITEDVRAAVDAQLTRERIREDTVKGRYHNASSRALAWLGLETSDIEPDSGVRWIGKSNPKLDALYQDVEGSSKPVIIITRFSCEAARIYDDLSKQYNCCLMTGWKRIGNIDDFKSGKYEVMIANIRVISKGFNLQNSYAMLFYSNTFSLEDRLQTEGRIYRIGQQNTCLYTDYVNSGTVDEKVTSVLAQRKNYLDYITNATTVKELLA